MKNLAKCVLISTMLFGFLGCSTESAEKAAADARVKAADARVDAADANARVKAADAVVVAADADARVAKAPVKTPNTKLQIPSGTLLRVSLIDALNSDTSSTGDRFLASLAEAVVVNRNTVLQKGTKVRGRVLEVADSGRVRGKASIRLTLTDILQGDRMVPITTDTFAATADSSQTRDAEIIAGGAGVGAVIGAIAGGKKGAGIGAISGGGAGTGVVLATKGKEIHYGPETRLNFTLKDSVEM